MAEPPTPPPPRPISLETRFDRFPVSVKGAFVLRGIDGYPHMVHLAWARLERIPSGPSRPVPTEDRMLDVAPARDLFVPFEVAVTDLPPSWYVVRSAAQVDGGATLEFTGRPFALPWPRNDTRRGTFRPTGRLSLAGERFEVTRVDLGAQAAVVLWRKLGVPTGETERAGEAASTGEGGGPSPAAGPDAVLLADGVELEALPPNAPGPGPSRLAPGERRTVTYPVPKVTRGLAVAVRLPTGECTPALSITLG